MSLLKMFCIFDVKAEAYSPPICFTTVGLAIRSFADEVGNENSQIHRYPADFDLREMGEFDPSTGSILAATTPRVVSKGADHVVSPPKTLKLAASNQ